MPINVQFQGQERRTAAMKASWLGSNLFAREARMIIWVQPRPVCFFLHSPPTMGVFVWVLLFIIVLCEGCVVNDCASINTLPASNKVSRSSLLWRYSTHYYFIYCKPFLFLLSCTLFFVYFVQSSQVLNIGAIISNDDLTSLSLARWAVYRINNDINILPNYELRLYPFFS